MLLALLSEPWHPTRVTWSILFALSMLPTYSQTSIRWWKMNRFPFNALEHTCYATWKLDRCHYHYQLWLCTLHFLPYQMIKFHHLQPLSSMPNKHVKHASKLHSLSSMSPENLCFSTVLPFRNGCLSPVRIPPIYPSPYGPKVNVELLVREADAACKGELTFQVRVGGGFQRFFIFTRTWGNDPIWLL